MSFKIVLPAERYQYDSASGTYTDVSTTDTGLDFLYNSDDVGTRVKIVGILRPNENAVSSMLSGAIGYTSALTDYLVEKAGQTEILQKQKADPDTDVILGLPFLTDDYSVSDEQKEADVTDYLEAPFRHRARRSLHRDDERAERRVSLRHRGPADGLARPREHRADGHFDLRPADERG